MGQASGSLYYSDRHVLVKEILLAESDGNRFLASGGRKPPVGTRDIRGLTPRARQLLSLVIVYASEAFSYSVPGVPGTTCSKVFSPDLWTLAPPDRRILQVYAEDSNRGMNENAREQAVLASGHDAGRYPGLRRAGGGPCRPAGPDQSSGQGRPGECRCRQGLERAGWSRTSGPLRHPQGHGRGQRHQRQLVATRCRCHF